MTATPREEFDHQAGVDADWAAAQAAADLGKPTSDQVQNEADLRGDHGPILNSQLLPNNTRVATSIAELYADEPNDPHADLGGGVPRRREAYSAAKESEDRPENHFDLSGLSSTERAAVWAQYKAINHRVISPVPPDTREAALADLDALVALHPRKK
jgi:hypothetical protein